MNTVPLLQSRTRRTTFIKRSYEKAFHFRTMTPNMIYRHQEPNATQIVSGSTTSPSTVNVSPAWTSDGTMRETIHCNKMWVLKIHVLNFMLNNGLVSFNGHFFSLIWFLCKKKSRKTDVFIDLYSSNRSVYTVHTTIPHTHTHTNYLGWFQFIERFFSLKITLQIPKLQFLEYGFILKFYIMNCVKWERSLYHNAAYDTHCSIHINILTFNIWPLTFTHLTSNKYWHLYK